MPNINSHLGQVADFQYHYSPALRASLLLAQRAEIDAAHIQCKAEIALNDEDGWAHDALGLINCHALAVNPVSGLVIREAGESFLRALSCSQPSPVFVIHAVNFFCALNYFSRAVQIAQIGVDVFGALPALQVCLAYSLSRVDQGDAARDIFRKLVTAAPHDAFLWDRFARGMHACGMIDDAIKAFETALQLDPAKLQDFGLPLSNLLLAVGRRTEAIATKERYNNLYATPKNERGQKFAEIERHGTPEQIHAFWEDIVAREQTFADPAIEAAQYYARKGLVSRAQMMIQKAISLAPKVESSPQLQTLTFGLTRAIPEVAALASRLPDARRVPSDDIIVVRGAADDDVLNFMKHYRAAHPATFIILSTWAETDPLILNEVSNYFDDIVLNERPSVPGISNINFQLVCAVKGVERARALGAKRIMVTRTDLAFLRPGLLALLSQKMLAHPPDVAKTPNLKQRLVISDVFTQTVPLYHASDIFCFGMAEDVAMYWASSEPVVTSIGPEVYLAREFAKRAGRILSYNFDDSLAAIRDLFVVCNAEELQLYWQKYPTWPNADLRTQRGVVTERVWSGQDEIAIRISADLLPRIELPSQ
jgi:tetratricopeptide (TPR) repeat protein